MGRVSLVRLGFGGSTWEISVMTKFEAEMIASMALGIVDDMQAGFIPFRLFINHQRSHDASCAVLLDDGSLAAQKVVLPIHIGAFPAVISGVLARYPVEDIRDGDVFLSNSPWEGGSPHSLILPLLFRSFVRSSSWAAMASIAHKPDIGGAALGAARPQLKTLF